MKYLIVRINCFDEASIEFKFKSYSEVQDLLKALNVKATMGTFDYENAKYYIIENRG